MTRRIGVGLLLAGACGACWIAPLLVGAASAGWLESMDVGLPLALGGGILAALSVTVGRRLSRRRRPRASAAPPA